MESGQTPQWGNAGPVGILATGIALVAVVFLCEGLYAMSGSPVMASTAGLLEVAFGLFCIYAGGAILLSEHFQKPVMPLGAPIFK